MDLTVVLVLAIMVVGEVKAMSVVLRIGKSVVLIMVIQLWNSLAFGWVSLNVPIGLDGIDKD